MCLKTASHCWSSGRETLKWNTKHLDLLDCKVVLCGGLAWSQRPSTNSLCLLLAHKNTIMLYFVFLHLFSMIHISLSCNWLCARSPNHCVTPFVDPWGKQHVRVPKTRGETTSVWTYESGGLTLACWWRTWSQTFMNRMPTSGGGEVLAVSLHTHHRDIESGNLGTTQSRDCSLSDSKSSVK